jgi:hypothetical protein
MRKRRTGVFVGGARLQSRVFIAIQEDRATGVARPQRNDEMLRQRTIARLRDALRIGLNGSDAPDFDIKKVRKRLETRKRMVKPQI